MKDRRIERRKRYIKKMSKRVFDKEFMLESVLLIIFQFNKGEVK